MNTRSLLVISAAIQIAVLLSSGPRASAAGFSWKRYAAKPEAWFAGDEAKQIAANALSHQSPLGSWPKNLDTGAKRFEGDPKDLQGTFDNGATTGELRLLARMFNVNRNDDYRRAFDKGVAHILQAQYANGGWPQFYPPSSSYHRHLTFNDDAIVNLMNLLREVAESKEYAFVSEPNRKAAKTAFDRGVACILKCQIIVKGELSVWCAQHDEVTLEPRKGRTYEHPSLSGGESANIVRLLMSIPNPAPEVVKSVNAAGRWYERSKLSGIRQTRVNNDKVIVPDATAPPLWARFYEIGTNRPIFSGRDGIIKYNIAEIEPERRNGYSWFGEWGASLLGEWAQWKRTHQLE